MTSNHKPFPVLAVALVTGAVIVLFGAMFIGMAVGGMGMHNRGGEVAASPTVIDAREYTIRISDFEFVPSNVSVPRGAVVTWTNEDNVPHDATDDSDSWQTETLSRGDSGEITFSNPGVYRYYCSIHPYMKGQLTVRAQ